ncbi:MAG TPA: hypothetical protein VL358_04405 [Caulobacteraceae bacterium]|jgi:hypothetical protein|nr:hypothetical protein [Caulobacteraceae bacterium]
MSRTVPELGPSHFAEARRAEQAQAALARRHAAMADLAALHAAQDNFARQADEAYACGAASARRDCDILEEIAHQLALAIEGLEPTFAQLDVARDVALYRGAAVGRTRSRYDPARLASATAEVMAEETLSGPAAAVLTAAVRAIGARKRL